MEKMKLIKNNESFMIILPKKIVLAEQWRQGQQLECKITEKGNLEIKEK